MTAPDPAALNAVTARRPDVVTWHRCATCEALERRAEAADAVAAAQRKRAEQAETELADLGDRISAVIAAKSAAVQERAERAESALSDALLRLAGGNRELHARLLADAGYAPALRCPAGGDEPS